MPHKRQSPSKRANAARALNHSIRTQKPITPSSLFSCSHPIGALSAQPSVVGAKRAQALQSAQKTLYSSAAVSPATRFGDLEMKLAHQRPYTSAGAFFVPAKPCYGGRAWETERSAGFQFPRFANLRTAATLNRLATTSGSSRNEIGVPPMKRLHALNPSPRSIRIAAHKAMALAALHANSSLSTRLARYNHHMQRARILEAGHEPPCTISAVSTSTVPAGLEVRHG